MLEGSQLHIKHLFEKVLIFLPAFKVRILVSCGAAKVACRLMEVVLSLPDPRSHFLFLLALLFDVMAASVKEFSFWTSLSLKH